MIKFTSKPFTLPGFPLIEQALNLFRVAVEGFVRDVNRCPLISGTHHKDVYIDASGSTIVLHRLGYKPNGWILTNIDASAHISEVSSNDQYIEFNSDLDTTVSLYIF